MAESKGEAKTLRPRSDPDSTIKTADKRKPQAFSTHVSRPKRQRHIQNRQQIENLKTRTNPEMLRVFPALQGFMNAFAAYDASVQTRRQRKKQLNSEKKTKDKPKSKIKRAEIEGKKKKRGKQGKLTKTKKKIPPQICDVVPPDQFLFILLDKKRRRELRHVDFQLTQSVLKMFSNPGCVRPANIIAFSSRIPSALAALVLAGLTDKLLLQLQRKFIVIYAWSTLYASVKTNTNPGIVRYPLMIVFPQTTAESAFFVLLAVRFGLTLSIRSGGNGYLNTSVGAELVVDTSLLRLSRGSKTDFKCCPIKALTACIPSAPSVVELLSQQIRINKRDHTVTVSTGVRLSVLYEQLYKHRLTVPAGICPAVATSLALVAGVGYLSRSLASIICILCLLSSCHMHILLLSGCTDSQVSFATI